MIVDRLDGVRVSGLADRDFVPYRKGSPCLAPVDLADLERQLGAPWCVVDGHHLESEYRFENFRAALAFTNRVGELAETLDHHPDIELAWGRVKLKIFTHDAGGLTESDFVWAARVDALR